MRLVLIKRLLGRNILQIMQVDVVDAVLLLGLLDEVFFGVPQVKHFLLVVIINGPVSILVALLIEKIVQRLLP